MSPPKPSSPSSEAPDVSILDDQFRLHPPSVSPAKPPSLPKDPNTVPEQALLESYARFRSSPLDAFHEFGLHVSGTGWRSYDTIVGQEIYYNGFSDRMKGMIMGSPLLRAKITELAEKRIDVEEGEGTRWVAGDKQDKTTAHSRRERQQQIETQLQEVALGWTDQMICKMESRRFIRGAYYLATQLLTRAYHQGIHVSSEEVLRLRAVAEKAAKQNQSIIFLPCHRSHVDYVSLQLICFRLGLALPTVVAGDNLNFPVVGPFLQHAGAMWIRRSFGDDTLYTTLVQSYIDTLLKNGYNLECFVEGGRSRTGKLLQPKFGILSFVLDSILSGRVDDAIICPVSTQYDKVIEVDSYVSELLGQPKPKESLSNFLSQSSILNLKLGRVDVRFHEPWSLRDFVNQQTSRLRSSPEVHISYDAALKRRLLTTLGYKALADINAVSVVMPTALIGTVLLTLRGRGVGKSELVRRVDWLCDRVRSRGGRVGHFANLPTIKVVERGLEVLGPQLVGVIDDLPEPTYFAVDRFQLSFYRNMTIHLFVSEALVCAAVYTRVKQGGGADMKGISRKDLYDHVYFLSQLFREEFIFPTTSLAENLQTTLEGLEADGILTITRHGSDITQIALSESERLSGREDFDFYCFLIWPFVEATWLGAVSLLMLTPVTSNVAKSQDGWLDLKRVQDSAQILGKTLYHQGDLSYFEAVNKETLKNAYTRFEDEGIIIVQKSRVSKTPTLVKLNAQWTPKRDQHGSVDGAGKLWEFCDRISQSRREGKNRRDGATVKRRVLSLVEMVGAPLWERARVGVAGNVDKAARTQRRRNIQTKAML